MLTDTEFAAMVKVFISYSHDDKQYCDNIKKYLGQLAQCGHSVDVWADHQIKAGEEWDETIEEKLRQADIILFLVSVNFITSRYIKDNELAVGYERREGGSAEIIPVLLSECMWEKTGLAKFQALPIDPSNKRAKPITTWEKDERDSVYNSIAQAIADKASDIIKNRQVREKNYKLQSYREKCLEFLRQSPDLKLSIAHQHSLKDFCEDNGIGEADAKKAFEEVQEPFWVRKKNCERYLETVKAYLSDRRDLSADQTKRELKDRQLQLKLEDGDIKALQPEIDRLAEEQRAKEVEERKAREEEAERNAEAERLAVLQRAKEEEDRRNREEEAKAKAEAERIAEEQRAKEEEERRNREEEAKRKAEEERLAEEQRAKEEADRMAREEEAERNAEAERLAVLQRAKEEEERKARDEEAKRNAEAEAERLASERLVREQQVRDQALQQVPKQAQNPQPDLQTLSISSTVLVQEESRGLKRLLGPSWRIDRGLVQAKVYQQPLAKALELTMVQIPAGSFQMGSPATEAERFEDEGPQRRVQLQSFFLGQTPVTQAQWKEVASWPQVDMKLNPDPAYFKGSNRPVEQVNWGEAMEFCRRLSQRTKLFYTLPSEAQWEYACRACTTSPFAFGDTLTTDLANYNGNSTYGSGPKGQYREQTTEVGSFAANAWGLQDMHGNVWEWCLDHWHKDYRGARSDGSAWVKGGDQTMRLLRGGSWNDIPRHCRSADRDWRHRGDRDCSVGFRLCRFPPGLIS
jgi:formylglycine-generating enzyme required for sulfatase activity